MMSAMPITDVVSHEGKNIQIFFDEQGNVIFKNLDEDKVFASVNVADDEPTCDDCDSTDICSRWKGSEKMCVKCCECDDCLDLVDESTCDVDGCTDSFYRATQMGAPKCEQHYTEYLQEKGCLCDECGCEIFEGNACPDEDAPFCEDCYNDLEECENCSGKFRELDGDFTESGTFYCEDCAESNVYTCDHCDEKHDEVADNEDDEILCLPCYEQDKENRKKKVHPVAALTKEMKPYDIVNGKKNKFFREFCEEQNLYLWGQFLKDTPYSLGEATLAGWSSTDDFARARGEYEYTFKIKIGEYLLDKQDKAHVVYWWVKDLIRNKKVHHTAQAIKTTDEYDIMNGATDEDAIKIRQRHEERNLMLFNHYLRETPYSLGEATLAGWSSTDDFARARGKYEYVFEPKQKTKKIKKPRKLMRRAKKEVEREDKPALTFGDVVELIMNFNN